jgi:hypothetical protein
VTPATAIPRKPKGFFASILAALHHSRRMQSLRVLREYRHLISEGDQRTAPSQPNLEHRENVDQ